MISHLASKIRLHLLTVHLLLGSVALTTPARAMTVECLTHFVQDQVAIQVPGSLSRFRHQVLEGKSLDHSLTIAQLRIVAAEVLHRYDRNTLNDGFFGDPVILTQTELQVLREIRDGKMIDPSKEDRASNETDGRPSVLSRLEKWALSSGFIQRRDQALYFDQAQRQIGADPTLIVDTTGSTSKVRKYKTIDKKIQFNSASSFTFELKQYSPEDRVTLIFDAMENVDHLLLDEATAILTVCENATDQARVYEFLSPKIISGMSSQYRYLALVEQVSGLAQPVENRILAEHPPVLGASDLREMIDRRPDLAIGQKISDFSNLSSGTLAEPEFDRLLADYLKLLHENRSPQLSDGTWIDVALKIHDGTIKNEVLASVRSPATNSISILVRKLGAVDVSKMAESDHFSLIETFLQGRYQAMEQEGRPAKKADLQRAFLTEAVELFHAFEQFKSPPASDERRKRFENLGFEVAKSLFGVDFPGFENGSLAEVGVVFEGIFNSQKPGDDRDGAMRWMIEQLYERRGDDGFRPRVSFSPAEVTGTETLEKLWLKSGGDPSQVQVFYINLVKHYRSASWTTEQITVLQQKIQDSDSLKIVDQL